MLNKNILLNVAAIFLGVLILYAGFKLGYFDLVGQFHLGYSVLPAVLTLVISIAVVNTLTNHWLYSIVAVGVYCLLNLDLLDFPNYGNALLNIFYSEAIVILMAAIILSLSLKVVSGHFITIPLLSSFFILDAVLKLMHDTLWNKPHEIINILFIFAGIVGIITSVRTTMKVDRMNHQI